MEGRTSEERAWTPAERIIREEIAGRGPMTFARFMELALYAPGAGYYEQPGREVGRRGDFYTSVSVGPVFGFLLAMRFADWCRDFERIQWVEAAAHDGRLADDLLTALLRFRPEVLDRVSYRILEPSAVRRDEQRKRLAGWGSKVAWATRWEEIEGQVTGVIFTNELLDAFPVHRYAWEAAGCSWFEWGVTVGASGLGWCRLPLSSEGEARLAEFPGELLEVLPDGFVVESSPGAVAWWRGAAERLARGWLLTLDYGEDRALRPERTNGTLRAYHQHRVSDDLLARPGEQDLTAHVDFGAVRRAGELAGLVGDSLLAQGRWLGGIAVEVLQRGGEEADWLQARARQLQTLTHPVHLGQAMKVLVQEGGGHV